MKKEKKILFVIGGLRAGGAEKVCVGLVNAFHKDGYDVALLVLNLHKAELTQYVDADIPVHNLDIGHARSALFPLRKLLKQLKVDTCLSFNFQLSVQLILLKKLFGIEFKLFSRGINTFSKKLEHESSFLHKYVNAFLIKKMFRKSDFFIAQSTGMKEDMIVTLGIPEDKIRVIFNPSFSLHNSDETSATVEKRKKEVLFVGSLKEQKNVAFLLDSISELVHLRNDFVFNIVGDGKLRADLESKAVDLQVESFVSFKGFSSNASAYYNTADVFVLGSWYEGFPNVLLEALSFGVPLVSVDCMSGPNDIIEEDINGYLVKDYDSRDFALKIDRAIAKGWDREKIKHTTQKFDFNNVYQQYKDYLMYG